MSVNRAFFPLRSNIGWYAAPELRQRIERTFKETLLICDEILVEAGTYIATILENGNSGWYLPPGADDKLATIDFENDFKPGPYSFGVESPSGSGQFRPVLEGHAQARFKINFGQMLKDVPEDCSPIRLVVVDPTKSSSLNEIIAKMVSEDERQIDTGSDYFFEKLLVNNVNRDLVTAMALKSGLILDDRHDSVLRRKSNKVRPIEINEVREDRVVHNILCLAVPEFDGLTLADVLEIRTDPNWAEFRGAVGEWADRAVTGGDSLVDKMISRALLREIEKKYKTGRKLVVDLVLGAASLVPPVGNVASALSAAGDVLEYFHDRRGWIAFVLKMQAMAVSRQHA